MTVADSGLAAPDRPSASVEAARGDRRERPSSRAALASRIDAARRVDAAQRDEVLERIVTEATRGYALGILGMAPTEATDHIVSSVVRRNLKSNSGDLTGEARLEELYLDLRTEAWRSQGGPLRGSGARILAAAALVVLVVGFGAMALSVLSARSADPAPVSSEYQNRRLAGRVVAVTSEGGESPRSGVEVTVTSPDGVATVVRTGLDGEFVIDGLTSARYELTVEVPAGLRLRGAADGRSTSVDLATQEVGDLTLRLVRP